MRRARPTRSKGPGMARATFWVTERVSNREKCWNTMPMPSSLAWAGLWMRTGRPSHRISPASGRVTP